MRKRQVIEIIIPENTKQSKAFQEYMAEKNAFKKAVISGNITSFIKEKGKKFDCPVSI